MTTPVHDLSQTATHAERIAPPCAIVIFGASGDLTNRKLLPALYNLALGGLLSDRTAIIGFARHPQTDEQFRESIRAGIDQYSRTRPIRKEVWEALGPRISYLQGNYDDLAAFTHLREHLEACDRERGTSRNRLFYVATPPNVFPAIVHNLGEA